ncbi:MAG: hypothetical protein AABO41_02890 [Acidobacteriota bacterium]
MRKLRVISLLILAMGLTALLVNAKRTKTPKKYPGAGYTMMTVETFYPEGGREPELIYSATRFVKANGEWKWISTHIHPDGTIQNNTLASNEDGTYRLSRNEKELDFLGGRSTNPPPDWHDSGFLRSLPQYYGDDSYLGYEVVVHRQKNEATGGYFETYFAPAIGKIPVKTVDYRPGEGRYVTEAVKIEIGEPPDAPVKAANLPVSYKEMSDRINSAEGVGKKEQADVLRRQVEADKHKH